MKIMFNVQHPAWVHQFHYILQQETERGNPVRTLVSEKDGATTLLESYQLPYVLCSRSTGSSVLEKGCLFIGLCFRFLWEALRFQPDIFIGRDSPMMAIAAWLTRKPHLIYEDTEVAKFSLRICKHLSTKILTPRTFLTDLGPRQERVDTYKELFYLHPSVFTPDKEVLRRAGFHPDEPYILVRFVAFNASHDFGLRTLANQEKIGLVKRLSRYGRVYVSSEGELPKELEAYRLSTPYGLIHHVLAFAQLVFSEGATMASEAVMLGVHALYVNAIVSGSTQEQSQRFDLMYCFNQGEDRYERAVEKAEELLSQPGLVAKGREKQQKLLMEKVDINHYFMSEMERLAAVGRKG